MIRTSGRPNFFQRCYDSVKAQTYGNYNILVSDDGDSDYVYDYPVQVVKVTPGKGIFWNDYMNHLLKHVNQGWVIYLDDDVTMLPDALETISRYCDDVRKVVVWKYRFASGRVIPEAEFWGGKPTRKHWDSGCFCHSFRQKVFWVSVRAADWRVGLQLWSKKLRFTWVDKVLFVAGNNGDVGKKNDTVLSK